MAISNSAIPLPMEKPKFIDPATRRSIEMYLDRIADDYPIEEVWLYGSRARGDAKPDSDADLALILGGPKGVTMSTAMALARPEYEILLETGILLSGFPIWKEDWLDPSGHSNPWLLANIKQDGIRL